MMTNELYAKLTRLQWLLHRQQMRGWVERGPMADKTRGQGRILAMLKLRDGISTKDLSYLLGVRISSLNELLQKMEKNGYITREQSEQDKRVMLVKLTEKGREEKQPERFDFDDIFSCLSEDEQRVFGEFLDRIIAALEKIAGDDGMFDKMASIKEKLGDVGAVFEECGRDFFGGRGFHHGKHHGCGPDHFGHGSYPGHHGCGDSGDGHGTVCGNGNVTGNDGDGDADADGAADAEIEQCSEE